VSEKKRKENKERSVVNGPMEVILYAAGGVKEKLKGDGDADGEKEVRFSLSGAKKNIAHQAQTKSIKSSQSSPVYPPPVLRNLLRPREEEKLPKRQTMQTTQVQAGFEHAHTERQRGVMTYRGFA
jgi:hypothetical protein